MARPSNRRRILAQALDHSPHPIYLLDSSRQIVYCNPALERWLERTVDEIIGQHVSYVAASSEPFHPWSGLCPPPASLHESPSDSVVWTRNPNGTVLRHRVRVMPLSPATDAAPAVLVVVDDTQGLNSTEESRANRKDPMWHRQRRRGGNLQSF